MAEKTSFILHHDQYEPIKGLTQEQKGDLLDAIFEYQRDGTEPNKDPIVTMAFSFFKVCFDREDNKWEAVAKRNAENGKKGGRPKKNKNDDLDNNPNEPKKPTGFSGNPNNPDEPKKAVNGNVNANANVNEELPPSGGEPEKPLKEKLVDKYGNDTVDFVYAFNKYVKEHDGAAAPKTTDKSIENACDIIDKFIRLDGIPLETIKAAIRWARTDEFWSKQIKSLGCLRRANSGEQNKLQKIMTKMGPVVQETKSYAQMVEEKFGA